MGHELTIAPPPPPPPPTCLAPGFRFHPTDEELVRYYLRRKVCGKTFRFQAVSEFDVYKCEPWELADGDSRNMIPTACKDSVAIFFMFDLTSRRTLYSVINWHQQARIYNQTAILVMVGSKFDEFVQLPLDLQWTIASEARAYAKALNATLFFSSASYNINVNKIFKFVTAKLFDLPWTLKRNLTIGEPIIDF